ncbi:hypothetical protein SHKM778_85680 [Streptomyces sp. KM77-8]|uniref:Uncharacterized protein n=1 Tax=Streptomyces haneummycinicus TaxID=3074435 RepID=A0AAT9HX81_9ACTN
MPYDHTVPSFRTATRVCPPSAIETTPVSPGTAPSAGALPGAWKSGAQAHTVPAGRSSSRAGRAEPSRGIRVP